MKSYLILARTVGGWNFIAYRHFFAATVLLISGASQAQEWRGWPTGNRLSIELGAFFLRYGTHLNLERGADYRIDLDELLDLEDRSTEPMIAVNWRIAERHSVRYAWFNVEQDARDFIEIPVPGFTLKTDFKTRCEVESHLLAYAYSLVFRKDLDIYFGAGLSLEGVQLSLTDAGDKIPGLSLDVNAPIPALLLGVDWALNSKWIWRNEVSLLAVKLALDDDYDVGSNVFTARTRLEWQLNRHLSLSAGYYLNGVDVTLSESGFGYGLDTLYHGLQLGLVGRF